MASKIFDDNGLSHLLAILKTKFVKTESGKGLSTNDLTNELLQKILSAGDSDFSGNYSDLIGKPDLSVFAKTSEVNQLIASALSSAYTFKGSVESASELPLIKEVGDVYNLRDTGMNVAWDGTEWDELGATIDLSAYVRKEDLVTVTNEEIEQIVANAFKD